MPLLSSSWARGAARRCETPRLVVHSTVHLTNRVSSYGCVPLCNTAARESYNARTTWPQVDIYSFGVVLWEIVTKEMPRRGQLRDVEVPRECPREISDLIDRCLQPNAVARPTAEEIFHYIQAAPRQGWAVDADGNQTGPSTPGNEDVPPLGTRLRSGRDITLPGNDSVVVANHVVCHVKGGSAGSATSNPSRLSVGSGIELVSAGGESSGSTEADSSDDGSHEGVDRHSTEPELATGFTALGANGSSTGASDPAKAIRPVKTSRDPNSTVAEASSRPSADGVSGAASMVTAQDHSGSLQSSRHGSERSRLRRLRMASLPHAPASPTTTVSTSAHSSIETSSSDAPRSTLGRVSKRFNGITDELLQKMLFREPVANPARPSAMVLAALADSQNDRGPASSWALSPARLNPFAATSASSEQTAALPTVPGSSDAAVVFSVTTADSAGQAEQPALGDMAPAELSGHTQPPTAQRLHSDNASLDAVAQPPERVTVLSQCPVSLRRNSL